MNHSPKFSPKRVHFNNETQTTLHTNRSLFQRPNHQSNRPLYMCTKTDQDVFPNTFHTL